MHVLIQEKMRTTIIMKITSNPAILRGGVFYPHTFRFVVIYCTTSDFKKTTSINNATSPKYVQEITTITKREVWGCI